jgi:hypothetical protein
LTYAKTSTNRKKSLFYLLIELSLVSGMLFVGAIIEWMMIENIPKRL